MQIHHVKSSYPFPVFHPSKSYPSTQVFFFIDPEILNDPSMDHVHEITLSYTFFKTEDDNAVRKRCVVGEGDDPKSKYCVPQPNGTQSIVTPV